MTEHIDIPIEQFQQQLLNWFEKNMRSLPWRKDKDPYRVWVSEIMLQQTQVDTVIPYYERFLDRFPTLRDLANAEQEDVLKHWEGLGYYSRARNLHQAVQEVQEQYHGVVPNQPEEIKKLKGVGPYTAGAILSIAYGLPEPAVDGNVMRVISRLFNLDDDISLVKTRKKHESIVRELIPKHSTSYFNQGLMELGALICTPRQPKCQQCPVQAYCLAHDKGRQQVLPIKAKSKKQKQERLVAGLLIHQGQVLIRQRPETGLLAQLFEIPMVEIATEEQSADQLMSHYLYEWAGYRSTTVKRLADVRHVFSHIIWEVEVYLLELAFAEDFELSRPERAQWVKLEELEQYAFPVSVQKMISQVS